MTLVAHLVFISSPKTDQNSNTTDNTFHLYKVALRYKSFYKAQIPIDRSNHVQTRADGLVDTYIAQNFINVDYLRPQWKLSKYNQEIPP